MKSFRAKPAKVHPSGKGPFDKRLADLAREIRARRLREQDKQRKARAAKQSGKPMTFAQKLFMAEAKSKDARVLQTISGGAPTEYVGAVLSGHASAFADTGDK